MSKIDKAISILQASIEGPLTPIQKLSKACLDCDFVPKQIVLDALAQVNSAFEVLTGPEDIYEINIPFDLLDGETKEALIAHKDLECFMDNIWRPLKCDPKIIPHVAIRAVKPTKPSINWDQVVSKFKWLAMDEDGEYFLFTEKPEFDAEDGMWKAVWIDMQDPRVFTSFIPGTCKAKYSLIERPKND